MKIIAVLETAVSTGGGFNQALNAILQMKKICHVAGWDFEILASQSESVTYLTSIGIDAVSFSLSIFDKLLIRLSGNLWWQSLQNRLKFIGPFEKKLASCGCDIAYFVAPTASSAALQRLNFIATVWDLCHRDAPEFPEVHEFNQFQLREWMFKTNLPPAVIVLTDSARLADAIASRYGVDRSRLLPMPFSPSPFLNQGNSTGKAEVLKKHGLTEGYYFYPAQFWPHKNHIRILEALLILRKKELMFRVVFSGGEQGSLGNMQAFVERHDLCSQVRFLGFVATEEMRGLYEACKAVVMPTYFGPTNVPPIEAWMLGKPLIYSAQFSEQASNAAILVNPDDSSELASAIEACADENVCNTLVARGFRRMREIETDRTQAEESLLERIVSFERRLSCWKQ